MGFNSAFKVLNVLHRQRFM